VDRKTGLVLTGGVCQVSEERAGDPGSRGRRVWVRILRRVLAASGVPTTGPPRSPKKYQIFKIIIGSESAIREIITMITGSIPNTETYCLRRR
jgi:hypothetical protein